MELPWVITCGIKGFEREIDSLDWLCRSANLPESNPGLNSLLLEKGDLKLGVITVLGRQFMRFTKLSI